MDSLKAEYLDEKSASRLFSRLFLFGITILLISLYFLVDNKKHFFFSYLTSFSFYLSVSLGSFFLVLIFYLTRAGWSVVIRRIPEVFMKNITTVAILFLPILFGLHELYHWTHAEEVAHDALLQAKEPYLNIPFFIIRCTFFFAIWIWLSRKFFNKSVQQDTSGDSKLTIALQNMSTYGILIYALTLTFSSIDWLMSLTPHWFSTIFGVYFFAGSVVAALAVTIITISMLQRKGYLIAIVTKEHFHDLGKLLYGFNVFWAYIAFSQYFLIWYANIPEETEFFIHHFTGSWKTVGIFLTIGHFAIPFVFFMSRHMKRNLKINVGFSIWLLIMHYVDLYWLIMPTYDHHGIHISIIDALIFSGLGCFYIAALIKILTKVSLFPVKDPRIEESMSFVNH